MICDECGAELENTSGTCPSCGAPVRPDSDVDEAVFFENGANPDKTTVISDSDAEATVVFDADANPDETSVLGNPDATAVRAPAGHDETVAIAGISPSPEATSVLGNADATAVFGEPAPDDVLSDDPLEDEEEEPVEYVRYEGYATFMPSGPGDASGIDVDPDELAGLEPIAVRDLGEDEIATTAIGPAYQIEDERPKSRRGLKIFLTVFIILLLVAGAACGICGRTLTSAPLSALIVSSATIGISREGSFFSVPFGLARYSFTSGAGSSPTARAYCLMKPLV